MKKKLVILSAISLLISTSALANNSPTFNAADKSSSTNICMKIATGTKGQFSNHSAQSRVLKNLKCNDMSVYYWADKHASPEVKNYVNRYNRNAPKGNVTITDIDID
jgi:hypothetical protein